MTTQKQVLANQQNALLSTGALTPEGKAIVSKNAVKHGIFTKDIIIDKGKAKENELDYTGLLNNLIADLKPKGQIQQLLVEKIAADFWRLKRVFRFENGDICKYVNKISYNDDYDDPLVIKFRPNVKSNEEIDEETTEEKESLSWNKRCIETLKQGVVNFDKPVWSNKIIEIDLEDDLFTVMEECAYEALTADERRLYKDSKLGFEQIREILDRAKITDKTITAHLIHYHEKSNNEILEKIKILEQQKQINQQNEDAEIKTCSIPSFNNSDKAMRYERSLQKSIFQNLIMLKKLQETG